MELPLVLAVQSELDMKYFQFQQTESALLNQVVLFGGLGVLLVGLAFGLVHYLRRKRQMAEMQLVREEARFRLFLTEIGLGPADRTLIETLTESDHPGENTPMLESRSFFEQRVKMFRESYPEHDALRRIPKLRQKLGFGFNNLRNGFDDTRMLSAGAKLQCKIPHPTKELAFVTSLMGVGEAFFFVNAPRSKGKPVNLGKVPNLTFSISREDDAEYQFTAKVLGQSQREPRPLILQHTKDIQRMLFRDADRVAVEVPTQFFVVRAQFAASRAHSQFKAEESQYAVNGVLNDLSLGGALVSIAAEGMRPQEGDLLVFRLEPAQIRDELVGLIVGTHGVDPQTVHIHLQFLGMKELNRLKLNRFLQNVPAMPAPTEAAAAAPQPGA